MDIDRLLRSLRSVRRFSPEPIPEDLLRTIVEDARWTGSSKNQQPWEVVVVRERETLQQLAECGPYAGHLAGAQAAVVLVMAPMAAAQFDAGRLSQVIMTAAWGHGLGSCIGSLYPEENERRAKELLGIPQELSAHTAISLGYPENAAALRLSASPENVRGTVPSGRKSPRDFASWERYGNRRDE